MNDLLPATVPTMADVYDPRFAPMRANLNPLRNLSMPRLVSLMENGQRGFYADLTWLYAHIERREHVLHALVDRRQSALGRCTWRVELTEQATKNPALQGLATEQQSFVQELFAGIDNLTDAWKWLGMATFRQFAHLEMQYDVDGMVYHLEPVPQWFWCRHFPSLLWDFNVTAMNTNRGQTVDARHFVIREMNGCIRELAAFDWVRKSLAMRDWSVFVSTFGIPNIFLEATDRNLIPTPGEMEGWRSRLERYVANGRGVLPPGVKATLFSGGSSDSTPFPGFTDYIDKMLVLAGTGGKLTMLSDATGIGAGATGAHQDAFDEIAENEGLEISDVMHRAIASPRLAEAWPDQPELVRFVITRKDQVDQQAGADLLVTLKAAGFRVNEEEAEKITGVDLTQIEGPASEVAPTGDQQGAATGEEVEMPDGGMALNRDSVRDPKEQESERRAKLATERIAATVTHDTGDAMTRLAQALGIVDETERKNALEKLLSDMPDLLAAANAKTATSDELEKLLVAGFAEGLQET